MTVSYAPGINKQKPMIRISNKVLATAGFEVGTKIEVTYRQDIITISKVKQS